MHTEYTFYVVVNDRGEYACYDWYSDDGSYVFNGYTEPMETSLIKGKIDAETVALRYGAIVKEVTIVV